MRVMRWVAAGAILVAGACDPTEDARGVSIKNDTTQAVVLRVCDSFGCDHLNDRLRPGGTTSENVSADIDPQEFLIVGSDGQRLGCLEVVTHPPPTQPILVSTMTACRE